MPTASLGDLSQAVRGPCARIPGRAHGSARHDPRFPVDDNWNNLLDEPFEQLKACANRCGVSGIRSAACCTTAPRCCGPSFTTAWSCSITVADLVRPDRHLAAKRLGFIDRLTPAGRTPRTPGTVLQRRGSARLFRRQGAVQQLRSRMPGGLHRTRAGAGGAGLRLRFDPQTEISIYRSVPHLRPAGRPR